MILSLGWAPTICSATCPPLKTSSVGMPRMLNFPAALMFSSTLSFTTLSLPACSRAISSTVGDSMWHGRHQSAQKSTITGCVLLASTTSFSKLASFTACMVSDILFLIAWVGFLPRLRLYILDVPAARGILVPLAASYNVTYEAADAFHEKS